MAVESGKVDRITGISSMAMRHVLAELGDAYEQQSGQPVAIVSVGGVDAARRVADGEGFDFVVLAADAIAQLAAGGRVDPGSRTDLARSGVAIAVATGAPRPDGERARTDWAAIEVAQGAPGRNTKRGGPATVCRARGEID